MALSTVLGSLLSNIGAGLIGGIADITGNAINYKSTQKTNETNKEINQSQLDFQRAQTQAQWERDDTAHQREVADLEAAGLSPLAATQGAQSSPALGAPSMLGMQAPQVDFNNLVQSALQEKAINETERHNREQEGQKNIELTQNAEKIQQEAQKIEIENKQVENTFKYQSNYLKYLADQLEETNRHNKQEEYLKKLQVKSEEYYKSIQSQTHGKSNYKVYTDIGSYEAALTKWSSKFEVFITNFISETSASHSESSGSSFNANAAASVTGNGGSAAFGHSGSAAGSNSYNVSQRQQAELERWYAANPMPVYYKSQFD